jgi:very-short-patch-repair endonuclease
VVNRCLECGALTKFKNIYEGYRDFCSLACTRKNKHLNDKRVDSTKNTLLTSKGVTNVMQLPEVKQKVSETTQERYGCSWYVQTDKFKHEAGVTNNENYGVTYPAQHQSVLQKIRNTVVQKYGRLSPRSYEKNRQDHYERVLLRAEELHITVHTDLNEHASLAEQLLTYSHTCGESWQTEAKYLPACPVCHRGSKVEKMFKEWAASLGVEVRFNDRSIISPLELDVVFPDKKLAIEINGLYWHCDEQNRTSVLEKTNLCAAAGIQLITIWEHEWLDEPTRDKIRNIISAKLGRCRTIGARKLIVSRPSVKEEKQFLEKYHLQGWHPSKIKLALAAADGEIVMMVTIGHSRFRSSYDYEIIRVCTRGDTVVVGGLSKLIKEAAALLPGGSTLGTYCDRRFGTGKGYSAVGMQAVGVSKPNYQWWRHRQFLSRYETMKHQLKKLLGEEFDPGLSEEQNMRAAGWRKISDAGNLKFIMKLQCEEVHIVHRLHPGVPGV